MIIRTESGNASMMCGVPERRMPLKWYTPRMGKEKFHLGEDVSTGISAVGNYQTTAEDIITPSSSHRALAQEDDPL